MENLNEILRKLVDDPKRVAIWSEILLNRDKKGISVKILEELLVKSKTISKSHLYALLNILEEDKIIVAVIKSEDSLKKKRIYQKYYHINKNFIKSFEERIQSTETQAKFIRDYRLFYLYLINGIIQREIRKISSKTNEEVSKSIREDRFYGKWMGFKKEDDFDRAQQILIKTLKEIDEKCYKDEKIEKKDKNDLINGDYLFYLGFINLYD